MDLSRYRKIVTLLVTAGVVFALNRHGLKPYDLSAFGLQLGGVTEPLVDFLLEIGIPAVFTLAQPNDEGESLLTYWRWIAGGTAAIAVLIVLAVAVPKVMA